MGRKASQEPSGRPVSDDRGNQTWEWAVGGELDTARLKELTEGLAVEEDAPPQARQPKPPGLDPYDKRVGPAVPAPEAPKKPRTLDDMRRLSDEIKKKRSPEKP
jgi:hypothetical protein